MSNYVAVKAKYYKKTKFRSLAGHVDRLFKKNKNSLPTRLPNFGDDVTGNFKYLLNVATEAKGKKFRNDSNVYIDQVVIFSHEQCNKLLKKHGYNNFVKGMTKLFKKYQDHMNDQYGIEPAGFKFHMDEGHYVDGKLVRNFHAHVVFLNYDFKTGLQPWRKLKPKDFSNFQDIAQEAFKSAGFKRGLSKEETNKKGLDKHDFVVNKKNKQIHELLAQNKRLKKKLKQVPQELPKISHNLTEVQPRKRHRISI